MIPIACKIANFSLHLFIYFFGNNYKIGELTSATSKERMTRNIIFASATSIKGAGGFMKPHKCYSLFIRYREKESCRSLNYSFED